ncbi:ROK family protein [Tepidibacillus sp. LV47]|uniref:ROK family protein n=1 Tax=Tepidibacillus sp. LV47 TaxID=3398228 RepID=UPI003AAC1D49
MSHSMQIGSFQGMKALNKATILNVIREHGPISRAEIAKLTTLTPPTVTNIVGELLESKIIVEKELGESTGGRKPILLELNVKAFYVIGVYGGANKIKGVVATLDGTVIEETEEAVAKGITVEEFLDLLTKAVRDLIEKTGKNRSSYLGIGVGMHGLVDPEKGISIFAPNLNMRNIPIKSHLEQIFQMNVEVENDVRALALGESWFGQGKDISNFVCVNVGTGIGAGIIIDHKLYHGTSFTAGEVGHTTIDINGPKCSCGNYGCLEALAAAPAIVSRMRQHIRLGKETILLDWLENIDELTSEMIYRAALEEDVLSKEVLADTGRYLGIGIANLINTFNPSKIILSGGVLGAGNFILKTLKETVERRALSTSAEAVSIVVSNLGKNAQAIGAFTLILEKLFTPSGVNKV